MKRTRINPVSKKRQELNGLRRAFVKRILSERMACECRIQGCTWIPTDVHEIKTRARGGSIVDPENVLALLDEAGGITHRIVQCLNSAAVVAIHVGIERITTDLLTVGREEPRRVLAAQRSVTAASRSLLGAAAEGSAQQELKRAQRAVV
jgi:hypothetical protein